MEKSYRHRSFLAREISSVADSVCAVKICIAKETFVRQSELLIIIPPIPINDIYGELMSYA